MNKSNMISLASKGTGGGQLKNTFFSAGNYPGLNAWEDAPN